MTSKQQVGLLDYLAVMFCLLISAMIGIKFRFSGGRQKTTEEFLMAGRNMAKFPVIFSVVASATSASAMLGFPSEVYRFGAQYASVIVSVALGMFLSAYIMLPVYFQCGVSTIYEFLEMRYGKTTKYAASVLFITQMVMYMAVVLYAPALALNAVTDISVEISVLLLAGVCTLYCAIGGLKAVLWADVFQLILMFACLMVVYTVATFEVGSVAEVYDRAVRGQRFNMFTFREDFTTRYTFWNMLFQGLIWGAGFYGTNQIVVQRLLCLSNYQKAKSAFLWSILPVVTFFLLCCFLGFVLYSVFYLCDPILNKEETGLNKYDQLVPYFIVTRLNSIPGMTGLCVAGIFSGALSTISSAINSLSTVTVNDFIRPYFSTARLTETRLVFIAKALALFYGVLCVCFTFIFSRVDAIIRLVTVVLFMVEGPMCAMFFIGVLTTKTSEKHILLGLFVGILSSAWLGFGSLFGGFINPALPLDVRTCPSATNRSAAIFENSTSICGQRNCTMEFSGNSSIHREPFFLYQIAFMWVPVIGCFLTILISLMSCLIFPGSTDVEKEINTKCISPVARLWIPTTLQKKSRRKEEMHLVMQTAKLTEVSDPYRNLSI